MNCKNHPDKEAFSICHGCGEHYCKDCLTEGKEYYYCAKPECQKLLQKELMPNITSREFVCPNCSTEIKLSSKEMSTGKIHCPNCEAFIDLTTDPPKVLKPENYVQILSSLNQVDVSLVRSILDGADIDYYVNGENFLSVDPLIQPAKFFILESQLEEVKELLKDYEPRVFGASSKNDMAE